MLAQSTQLHLPMLGSSKPTCHPTLVKPNQMYLPKPEMPTQMYLPTYQTPNQ